MSRIYLDTCIIIYLIEKHPNYSSKIETLLTNLTQSELCYSPLTRLECFVMPFRTNDLALLRTYETFFNAQKLLTMSTETFDEAAKLRANFTTLKTPDALHLATTFYHNCDELWTNDNRLSQISPIVKNILIV